MLRSPADVSVFILKNPLETSGLNQGGSTRQVSSPDRKQECLGRVDMGTNRLEDRCERGKQMARLDAAMARFNAALDVLESGCDTLANRTSDSAPQIDHSEEIAALKSEREQLLTRIAAFEEESQSLAGMAEVVETRLDGAITEIRAALGRG